MKICISRLDKMGDMIFTLPVIKAIKINNPGIKIFVLASQRNVKVLKGLTYIDEIIEINTSYLLKTFFEKILTIRKLNFDFYFNLSPTFLSYLFCFFSNAKNKATLIFLSRYKKPIFSKLLIRIFSNIFCKYVYTIDRYTRLKNNQELHQTKMILNLINMCNISFKEDTLIDISLPNKKIVIPNNKSLVTIHVPDRWIGKFYTEENFIDLVSKLPQKQFNYVLTTDQSTKNKFKKIFNSFEIINNKNFKILKNFKNNIVILEEPNYENWLEVIYSSAYVITPECGCLHISAACNVPVNIIYDPNNLPDAMYKEYHPWKSSHKKFVFGELNLNKKIADSLI